MRFQKHFIQFITSFVCYLQKLIEWFMQFYYVRYKSNAKSGDSY